MKHPSVPVTIAHKHVLIRKGLAKYISSELPYKLFSEVANINDLNSNPELHLFKSSGICICDIPSDIESFEDSLLRLRHLLPSIKILGLLPENSAYFVSRSLSTGINGLMFNDCNEFELKDALAKIWAGNYFFPDSLRNELKTSDVYNQSFSSKEKIFLTLCCSELTYKEIAQQMKISLRAVDAVRESLFKKLDAVSRTGLAIKALKHNILTL